MDAQTIKQGFARITGKQFALLSWLAAGRSIAEFAVRQNVTEANVRRRLRQLLAKFEVDEAGLIALFEYWRKDQYDEQASRTARLLKPFLADPSRLTRFR